ncbi:MAG: S41 family peptidase, partial [Planctomycetota bacterium]|nr:S41 family peptidase [Planctomycetota bacterium]MDI6787775.1 S41 family peptidase [Planctomycetota bacterium]
MKIKSSLLNISLIALVVLVVWFIITARTADNINASVKEGSKANIKSNLDELKNLYSLIADKFVVEPNKDQLFENAMKGMVSALDPYSEYMNAEEYNEFVESTRGEFGGIGVEITIEDGFITVVTPIEDTPAFRAGLLPGDKILEIDGVSAEGMSITECARRVRGKPVTSVTLKILHKNDDMPVNITLVREIIKIKSVKDVGIIDKKHRIGYLRITAFQEDTLKLFDEGLKKLQEQGMKSLIIDVRFNGGGLMETSVKIANRFIAQGIIVSVKGRIFTEERKSEPDSATVSDIPVVVLVNGSSASASEIVAGALQDHRRATLIGSRTYGKGSVQSVFPITDAGGKTIKGAIKLTIARYYTPSGRCLEPPLTSET